MNLFPVNQTLSLKNQSKKLSQFSLTSKLKSHYLKGFFQKKQSSLMPSYPAMPEVEPYLKSDNKVTIISTKNEISFVPNMNPIGKGILFYPGAMVDKKAYAPLAKRLANKGFFVIISDNDSSSILNNKPGHIIKKHPDIKSWTMAGHSLGGLIASESAHLNSDKVSNVILLSSFPVQQFKNKKINFLDVRATNDKIINKTMANTSYKFNVPSENLTTVTIEGGNHGYFGYYNDQKGDGTATISREEQQQKLLSSILEFLK